MKNASTPIEILGNIVKKYSPDLSFSIFEIGAAPLVDEQESFYKLAEIFPKSKISAFEVDEAVCADLNIKSRSNITYYPTALGSRNGEQVFYETNAPMCCSLYQPNDAFNSKYNNLEVALLKSKSTIKTTTLDTFIQDNSIDTIDFIKIDVQGAELDIFKGGIKAMANTLLVVSEVEFVPLYIDQPLFGDVCQHFTTQGLMFHKFLKLEGRTLKPIVLKNDINAATQHMWSDAVFIKDIAKIDALSSDNILKLSLLAFLYGSADLTFYCFQIYDDREKTTICDDFAKLASRK
tara:strand:+ start:2460 stop:3335 length:876 start_codon:yes stop_codon:yes gene_type:complete